MNCPTSQWCYKAGVSGLSILRTVLAAIFLLVTGLALAADVAVPVLKARVTDLTATLSADQTAALESKLAAFETKKGSQLAVLLVPTTQPEAIEQYSLRVWSNGSSVVKVWTTAYCC